MTTLGFFTDATLCIGCKACEVACKQWNDLPDDGFELTGMSYDNTAALGAATWRHVLFRERAVAEPSAVGAGCSRGNGHAARDGANGANGHPAPLSSLAARSGDAAGHLAPLGATGHAGPGGAIAWKMLSDVCKHCERAGCLEACPTGAILRTEHGSVFIQPDVCNGCGYCIPACPFGVVARSEDDGRAFKCTLCYDRLQGQLEPACAKACPTDSIQFGPLDELRARAAARVAVLHDRGVSARLYGESAAAQPGTGGLHAFFLIDDAPEAYNLPPAPSVPTIGVARSWLAAAAGALGLAALAFGSVLLTRRDD